MLLLKVKAIVLLAIAASALLVTLRADAVPGFVTTYAGNGRYGATGDGGPATQATLSNPWALASDRDGNIYISAGLGRIRKVDARTGIISAVAGNGWCYTMFGNCSLGDGGPAVDAKLGETSGGIAVSVFGDVFIADTGNHRVRKVDHETGIITTIAGTGVATSTGDGGPATEATLQNPGGIALDSKGNIYVAEIFGDRIRKIDSSTGIITTYAGTGVKGFFGDGGPAISAKLNDPMGISMGPGDDLYIADRTNVRIRKVDHQTGIITTVAGGGTIFKGSWQDPAGDGMPATQARLYGVPGVAVASNGDIYIADGGHYSIRKVDAMTGRIYRVAGHEGLWFPLTGPMNNAPAQASFAWGPANVTLDPDGNFYFTDGYNIVRRVDAIALPSFPTP